MTIDDAIAAARAFRDERDWSQFHTPKDLAISVSVESGELLQCFQWSGEDLRVADKKPEICDELADVMIYCAYLADALGVDPGGCHRCQNREKRFEVSCGEGQGKFEEIYGAVDGRFGREANRG